MSLGVIVPVYAEVPDANEQLALTHNLSVLKNREVIFVHPAGLNTSYYRKVYSSASFESFEARFFDGIMGYNELMLSEEFYKRFVAYDYLLILQLDAWVFEDSLDYWIEQGYDYVGAPDYMYKTHPSSWHTRLFGRHLMNGGLSLRKTAGMLKALKLYNILYRKGYRGLEDSYFSAHYARFLPVQFLLRLPDYSTALTFAFEKSPSAEFAVNGNKMPFGCHAYLKFEPDFWKSKGVIIA